MPKQSKNIINEINYSKILSDERMVHIIQAECCGHCAYKETHIYPEYECSKHNVPVELTDYCKRFRREPT
jgi:hypothetical protein